MQPIANDLLILDRDLTFEDFVQRLAEGISKFILRFNGEIVVFHLKEGGIKLVFTEDLDSFITVPVQDIGQFDWLGSKIFGGNMTVVSLIRNICHGNWPLKKRVKGTRTRDRDGLKAWLQEPQLIEHLLR